MIRFYKVILICFFVFFQSLMSFGQAKNDVQIRIVDELGNELIGVSAMSSNQSFISITDIEGLITIPGNLEGDLSIEFSYLGFQNISITVDQIRQGDGQIILLKDDQLLDEVIVVGRNELKKENIPYAVSIIDAKAMKYGETQSTADALMQNADVFVQKSQMGGGSPIVRGFEANKVLLVVDGVRMNNAIYRSGHLQNAITVDQQMLDRIEVIYGPASLTYGSDALGGVVHFRTKNPKFSSKGQGLLRSTSYLGRYSSANEEKLGHLNFSLAGKSWASLTSFSYADFGDLRSGAKFPNKYPDFGKRTAYVVTENGEDVIVPNEDPTRQVGTAYSQFDLFQKFLFQIDPNNLLTFNMQYSSSSDIPRYDQLSEYRDGELRYAEWNYGPQDRMLLSAIWSGATATPIYDRVKLISSMQFIEEDRIKRNFGSEIRNHQLEDVYVYSITLDFIKELDTEGKRFVNYGAEFSHNDVLSTAYNEDIFTGTKDEQVFTRYPDGGSDMNDFGIYSNIQWPLIDSLLFFNGGLRYSYHQLESKYDVNSAFEWPEDYYNGIGLSNHSLTWSAGIILQPKPNWRIQFLSGSAFRAPNVDDFAKVRVKGANATVPNPNLKPEESINFEVGTSYSTLHKERGIELGGNVFYTQLKNAIVRDDFRLENGDNTIIIDDETYNVQANVNANNAVIYGLSSKFNFKLNAQILFENSLSYTYGRSYDKDEIETPLAHIPPLFGKSSLSFKNEKWMAKAFVLYNGQKALEDFAPEGSSDNVEYATPEGALAWYTLNASIGYQINRSIAAQFSIENILDTHYRVFSSGLSAPGRNIILSIKGDF